jgi:CO/xanthine dehydrogenase Mo-binding subunit
MKPGISTPVKRVDGSSKISGEEKYISDIKFNNMLYAKTFRSSEARAKILSVEYPMLPDGYYIIDKNDVPGINRVNIIKLDMPLFADGVVNYIGEPVALVAGRDKKVIDKILSEIKVEYEKIKPILTIEEGLNTKEPIYGDNNLFAEYEISKGDIENIKKEAKYSYSGEYETGYQEQLYMEPQGVTAVYEKNKITVYGSMQCPYYIFNALKTCLGFNDKNIRVVQTGTGGGFGGKEDYPSLIAGQAACAAVKCKKPVQLVLERSEDIQFTTKRHPSKINLTSYIDENYKVLGMEADIKLDAGAYASLSEVVLQRAVFASCGVYNIENLKVKGYAVATNKAVSGAFRGFGAPQAFYAIETHMEHIAKKFNIDPLEFKIKNLLSKGNYSATGGLLRDNILLPQMIDRAVQISSYKQKKKEFIDERKRGALKGIGMSLFFHGGGFTGSGERDMIKGIVKLIKDKDKVEILAANVEMGQGVKTTFRKIVSNALNIPLDKVIYENPDTDRVPNSGPTVASRSIVIVGNILKAAAEDLKKRWDKKDHIEITRQYVHPEGFKWDNSKFYGDAYTSYSWGVNVVEVELNPLTYESTVKSVWAVYDIGNAIDDLIVKGQIDGGILQGLGLGGMEVIDNTNGSFMQKNCTDYIIPTSMDTPEISSELMCEPFKYGPYGAKALGELTLVGTPAAYALAVEDALDIEINSIPVRPEYLMEVVSNGK